MCDHAAGFKERTPDPERLALHNDALREVRRIIDEVKLERLSRMAIAVNKSDLWKRNHSRVDLLEQSGISSTYGAVGAEQGISIAARDSSALFGDDVKTVIALLSGR